jgi:hypothetical protein
MSSKFAGFALDIRDTREEAAERKADRRSEREDPKHLAAVRKLPCCVAGRNGHRCRGRVEAHHEPSRGKRADHHDHKTLPLCMAAHKERHTIGKLSFFARYGIDPQRVIEQTVAKVRAA